MKDEGNFTANKNIKKLEIQPEGPEVMPFQGIRIDISNLENGKCIKKMYFYDCYVTGFVDNKT